MSDADPPPQRPTSHRASAGPTGIAIRVIPPLLAVVVVVGVVLILLWLNGHHDNDSSTVGPLPTNSFTPSLPPTSTSTPTPTTSARPSPTASHKASHSAKPRASQSSKAATASQAMASVEVLNNSRRTGLAHQVAAEVEGRGWQIYRVGNLRGRVIETTVYYAPGDAAAAQHLAREFGSIRRILPNSALGLSDPGLTLVLTADWGG